jgi:hypothetical protein
MTVILSDSEGSLNISEGLNGQKWSEMFRFAQHDNLEEQAAVRRLQKSAWHKRLYT